MDVLVRSEAITLSELMDLMVAKGAVRVRLPDGLEVDLAPGFRVRAGEEQTPVDLAAPIVLGTLCACGHSLEVQHGPAGCDEGCSLDVCRPASAEVEERRE